MQMIIYALILWLPMAVQALGPHTGFAKECVAACNKHNKANLKEAAIIVELQKFMGDYTSARCQTAIQQLKDSRDDRFFVTKAWRKLTGKPGCHDLCLTAVVDYCLSHRLIKEADLPN
ncbi:MAG: hypothetical protein ACK5O7_06605 [Holosporales bacterium]